MKPAERASRRGMSGCAPLAAVTEDETSDAVKGRVQISRVLDDKAMSRRECAPCQRRSASLSSVAAGRLTAMTREKLRKY